MKNPELKERFKSWIPHGMEFIGPDQTERILAGCARLREAFAALGAREVIPPLLDFAPTFEMARQSEMASFQTRDMAGELLAFRSDLTVQIIKAAASGVFGQPGNYSYVQTILLDAAAGSGHRRELLQAGIEFLGPADRRVETMIGLIADIRKDAIIVYGDTSFLRALLSGLSESDFAAAMKILDRKDIQGLRSFCESRSVQNSTAQILCELPFLSGASLDPLKQAAAGRSDLLEIIAAAPRFSQIVYDFGLVRDLSYYTGPVFQGYLPGGHEPFVSGGVYDGLFEKFSGRPLAACGLAFDVMLLTGPNQGR